MGLYSSPPRLRRQKLADGSTFYTPKGTNLDVRRVEREVSEYFEEGIRVAPGDVVFDVGANIGLFALHAARAAGGDVSLYCFEPIPAIFGALSTNSDEHPILSRARRRLFQMGLTSSDDVTETEFYYFKNNPCDSTYDIEAKRRDFEDVFATFGARFQTRIERTVPGALGRWVGGATGAVVASVPKGTVGRWMSDRFTGMEKVECKLSTLGKIAAEEGVERIDLLKIDVEGAELDVLLGIGEATWPKVRQIVLEGHDKDGRLDELKQLLESKGMRIGRVGKPKDTEALGLANFMLTAFRD